MAKTAVETLKSRDDSAVEREYQVPARKFRPRQFADVVGQDHIIKTLQRKIVERKLGHAFLFVGPRGCGKTTTARLLAMASNCENLSADGEPCGKCATCASIVSGAGAIGLHELDAASNRGIGEMKALIETMGQGSVARKKVYIIDEAHMLTKEASNALLKTLEEPPADTLIILATTEANKVLPTIQSRATRYNFKTVDSTTMTELVKEVVAATGVDIDEDGIAEVVRRGHGSPRDTLTHLEGYGGEDASDDVRSFIPTIADALAAKDSSALIISIADAVSGGIDIPDLTRSLLEHWRNCLLAVEAPAALSLDAKEIAELAKQGKTIKPQRLVRLLNVTAEALGNMANTGDSRVLLEMTLLQIAQPSASDSLEGIYDQFDEVFDMLDDLKKLVKKGVSSAGNSAVDWPPAEKNEVPAKTEQKRVQPVEDEVVIEKQESAEPVVVEAEEEPETKQENISAEAVEASDNEQDTSDSSDDSETDEETSQQDDATEDSDETEDSEGDGDDDQWDYDDESTANDQNGDSDDSDEESDSDDDQNDASADEDDEPALSISELYKDDKDSDDPEHNHDEEEASGFLDCGHPECVEKLAQVKKAEKDAPRKAKGEAEKKEPSKDYFDEDKAPTARDLVEVIQWDLVDRRFQRYLQDDVMTAAIEEDKDGVYLVLRHRKSSERIPTKAAIDAITACVDNLWVDDIEYIGKER